MANSEYNYIPTYIRRIINNRPKDVVTAKYWNELFNLLITQGDHTAEELGNILNHFSTRLVGVESEIAESAEAIANIRGAFRINVTSSNGVYSADKTFAEIKAAYEAGQQPYVVQTGGTLDLVYTLASFDAPTDGSEPKFVDFERYLAGDGILETEMLRIYSYTTDSGSNVVKRIDEFKIPTSLKNPNALTFTGGATGSYDGSEPETVHIPVIPYEVINKNTAARHSHDNKTVLDGITAEQVAKWNNKVSSVNGKKGDVVLNAEDVGAQRTLIAGSGITIIPSDNVDIIQSNISGSVGNGLVSFVNNGVSIAQFTLNQTQDCEINVNDLTAHLHNKFVDLETADNKLEASLSNNYRTAANQDKIDSTKLTDAPTDGKEYARKNGSWHEIAVVDVGVESVNGKTGVVTLNATEIPSTKLVPTDTISFLIDGAFDEALVGLTLNGASASANDFISAINSGATVTVSLHDQGNPKVTFDGRPVKYKITNDTLSLCFIAEAGHTYTPAIYVLSGTTSGATVSTLVEHNFTDSFYQENYVSANDLPVQAPLTVEEYLEELESSVDALQPKSITDTGSYFTTDTVEGALQEIGAELAGINTLLGSGIQISFTIGGTTCTANAGETWTEWVGSGYKTIANGMILSVPYGDDGVIFLDEAGVYALSLDGNTPVRGGDRIISGATYDSMNWGG